MMINETSAIQSVMPTTGMNGGDSISKTDNAAGTSFVDWVSNEMMIVNDQINTAELNLRELATGKADNLHQVMTSLSKAKTSFELAVEVRNKLLEGYQEIMRMQV
jgi:flagellar hook-basal body complex protein FliE